MVCRLDQYPGRCPQHLLLHCHQVIQVNFSARWNWCQLVFSMFNIINGVSIFFTIEPLHLRLHCHQVIQVLFEKITNQKFRSESFKSPLYHFLVSTPPLLMVNAQWALPTHMFLFCGAFLICTKILFELCFQGRVEGGVPGHSLGNLHGNLFFLHTNTLTFLCEIYSFGFSMQAF